VTEPRRGRLLLGAFPTAEQAVAFAERVSAVPATEIEQRWSPAREAFLTSVNVGAYDHEEADEAATTLQALEQALRAPLFRASVEDRSWRIVSVNLESLVTSQPLIQLDRVAALERRLSEQNLLRTLFPGRGSVDPHVEVPGGAAIALVTERADLAVSKIEARQTDLTGSIDVTFRLEPRPNYLTVLRLGSTLVVRNGNHRLVAAWRHARRRVPCVLIDTDDQSWNQRPDRFPPNILQAHRLPRIADLVKPNAASIDIELEPRRFVTLISADQHWSSECPIRPAGTTQTDEHHVYEIQNRDRVDR